uniref:Glycosyl transferase 64 domain-containing protein n=1 Tax=Chenopodium quinoa TaxID=63459 RepID=A0A803N1A3_CHEQI
MEVRRRYIFSLLKFIIILHLPPSTLSHRSLSLNLNPLCDRKTLPNPQSLRSDQLTVLINGYSELRISLLSTIAGVYAASPVIAAVVVLWGNPSTPAETLDSLSSNFSLLYSAGAPVTVVRQKSNSLNSRFLPRRWIRTRGVLICDDDVEVDPKSIEFAFKVWQGPLLVGAERVRDWGDARNEVVIKKREKEVGVGLSGVKRGLGKHRKRRGECIREFHKVLGRMSLRYSYGTVVSPINEQGLCEKGGKLVPCDQQIFE